ncbi:MAG: homoserine kinase, partial [Chloroflexota bacterium]
ITRLIMIAIAEAYAPATSANLGVGFDIIGLALQEPGDTVIAERRAERGVSIAKIEGDGGRLPLEVSANTAGVAASQVFRAAGADFGAVLTIKKGLPLGSGLGSSSASAVAGALAANALLETSVPDAVLLEASLHGEAVASGYHVDNVGPALFGGLTLFTEPTMAGLVRLPVPSSLFLALVTPDVEVKTSDARAVLPGNVALGTMVRQTGAVARLVDALHRGDVKAMGRAMEGDGVIEAARKHLIPQFDNSRAIAHELGAHALVISGAGPTLLAICEAESVASRVVDALKALYLGYGIGCIGQVARVSEQGARVVRK